MGELVKNRSIFFRISSLDISFAFTKQFGMNFQSIAFSVSAVTLCGFFKMSISEFTFCENQHTVKMTIITSETSQNLKTIVLRNKLVIISSQRHFLERQEHNTATH
jgi:hypothetical protein